MSPRRGRISKSTLRINEDGFSILELIIVIMILSILTTAAVPMVRNSVKRERESELRLALRQLRRAIDDYKRFNDMSGGAAIPIEVRNPTRYTKELKVPVEGFIPANVVGTSQNRIKFLRKIPVDPMTGNAEWGLRSYKDKPDSTEWGGEDIYDVFSKSTDKALNGTQYKDW